MHRAFILVFNTHLLTDDWKILHQFVQKNNLGHTVSMPKVSLSYPNEISFQPLKKAHRALCFL